MKLEPSGWDDRGSYRVAKLYDLDESCFLQLVEIKPNESVGKHYHMKQTEVFVVLSGEARFGIGEKEYNAKPGDIYICNPGERHWVVNGDKRFRLLVFKYNYADNDIFWE